MHYLIAALLCVSATVLGAPTQQQGLEDVAHSYIVKLKPRVSKTRIASFLADYKRSASLLDQHGEVDGNHLKYQYSTAINGFSGKFTSSFLDSLKATYKDEIEYIVPDGIVTTMGKQENPEAWGLTRISQRTRNLPAPYYYPDTAGEGVDVWVVDTGVFGNQTDFGGRASLVKSFIDGEPMDDLNGHGTHCAGTIGSLTYGVAKKVTIKGVKVLSGSGSGTWSGVLSGVDFVAKNVRKGKTVMSMSLGGGKNQALNDAVNNAVKAGVVAIIAAGNNGGDACQISPASAELAYSVAATDNKDTLASFSNRGKCVKIAAPGVNVKSLWKGVNGAVNTISGTSMATPHVAGVAALLMSQKDYGSAQEVYAALTALATKGKIQNLPADGTPNLLLYNGAGVAEDDNAEEPVPVPVAA